MCRHQFLFLLSFFAWLCAGVLENLKYRDRIELGSVDGDTVTLPFVALSENSEEFLRAWLSMWSHGTRVLARTAYALLL